MLPLVGAVFALLIFVSVLFAAIKGSRKVRNIELSLQLKADADIAKAKHEHEQELAAWKHSFGQVAMETANRLAEVKLAEWIAAHTTEQRADAIKKSQSVNRGLVAEQLAPFLEGFHYNPKDARFIGQPLDYLIFDGLHDGELREIVLMEVKTGSAVNNVRENQIKRAVKEQRVRYEQFRPDANQKPVDNELERP